MATTFLCPPQLHFPEYPLPVPNSSRRSNSMAFAHESINQNTTFYPNGALGAFDIPSDYDDILNAQCYVDPPQNYLGMRMTSYGEPVCNQDTSLEQFLELGSKVATKSNPSYFDNTSPQAEHLWQTQLSNNPLAVPGLFQDDFVPTTGKEELSGGQQPVPNLSNEVPICWEHGCNGRIFSSRSNLRRHQRERSRLTPECYCPRCGAYFSRTSARNLHLANMSCTRIRRYSNGRLRPMFLKIQESMDVTT